MIIKILTSCFVLFAVHNSFALDLGQTVSGSEVENTVDKLKVEGTSPYLSNENGNEVEKVAIPKNATSDYVFGTEEQDLSIKNESRQKLIDFGFTVPGSMQSQESYIEIDKAKMAEDFRKHSSGAINIAYIKDNYTYQSTKDVINRTIGEGYKHVKGGTLVFRSDRYFFRSTPLNIYWSGGGGVGFNSGRGIFTATGERSDTTFKLWEVPVDLGLGLEVPLYHWFKIAGTAGPSALVLMQNRNDFQSGEKGKNKTQFSSGVFANAQFKINLAGFNDETAYNLFTESKITNLTMNIEVRYQSYKQFQDPIEVSGTSAGIGFTFEYL